MKIVQGAREVFRRGLGSSTFKNTSWSASSWLVNGASGAITSAIFARYLTVPEFGILVLVLSLSNLVSDLSDLGISSSIVRFGSQSIAAGDRDRFRLIASVVFRTKLILGSVVVLLALAFLNPIVSYVFSHVDERITAYFRLSLVSAWTYNVASISIPVLQAHGNFRLMSFVTTSRYIAKLLIVVCCMFVVKGWTVSLGIWIEIASVLVFLVAGIAALPVKTLSLKMYDHQLGREMLKFNRWISLHQIVALIGGRLDVFFIGGLADARALGVFGAASKIAALMNTSMYSYSAVLQQEFSAAPTNAAMQQKRRNSLVVVVLLLLCIGVIGLLAHPIVVLIFGQAFSDSAILLQVMCVGLSCGVAAYPLTATLFALNKSVVFPASTVLSMSVFVVSNIVLIPRLGVIGAAISFSISGAVGLIVAVVFYIRYRKMSVLSTSSGRVHETASQVS